MGLHEMQIMDTSGHLTVEWDAEKDDEVEAAREQFDKFTRKGYSAFTVRRGSDGKAKEGERLRKFDADVEEMILVPAMRGG